MADSQNDYLRVDATAEMTRKLDEKMAQMFPILSPTSGIKREEFLDGQVAHVSLVIPRNYRNNPEFQQNIITLLQAAKTPSHPAYSEHGSNKHQTYDEVLNRLIDNINTGSFSLVLQSVRKQVGIQRKHDVLVNRVILQPTEAVERITYRPVPHQTTNEILDKDRDEKVISRKLRQLTREHGAAFGILMLAYIKPNPQDIFDFFDNKEFKRDLDGLGYKTPSTKRPVDTGMISGICNLLRIDSAKELLAAPSPEKYKQVLGILIENGYLTNEIINEDKSVYGFRKVVDVVLPKIVFVGADEKAQDLAPDDLQEPKRTEHIIESYGNRITSIVATAFIENLS